MLSLDMLLLLFFPGVVVFGVIADAPDGNRSRVRIGSLPSEKEDASEEDCDELPSEISKKVTVPLSIPHARTGLPLALFVVALSHRARLVSIPWPLILYFATLLVPALSSTTITVESSMDGKANKFLFPQQGAA
jgi:hypothetical protein